MKAAVWIRRLRVGPGQWFRRRPVLLRTSRGPLGKWTKCEQCAGPQFVLFLGEESRLGGP